MTEKRRLAGTVTQEAGVTSFPVGWISFLVLTIIVFLFYCGQTSGTVLNFMEHRGGWGAYLKSRDTFLLDCMINSTCSAAFQQNFLVKFRYWTLLFPILGFIGLAYGSKPRMFFTKDPGLAWWAQLEDKGIQIYRSHDAKRKHNTLHGYIGHLMHVERSGSIDYKKTTPLFVRMDDLCENVLILGGVGAGKTRGYFRPLILLAAHLGFSVIVFDLKYPQADSGFFDMIGYWIKKGRKVMMFTPFAPHTMRLPLLDSVEDYASALSTATTIMPPPEYGVEPGKFYRDRDRGVLAAFLLAVAKSDTPNFAELLNIAQYTPNELKTWFERQVALDPTSEVVMNLKGVFAQGNEDVAGVLQGIKNALRIFYNPLLARATQSHPGENMNIREAFRQPTLLYIGIQQEHMMEGDGVVLLQLVKRFIDRELQREAAEQGGKLKRHVAYVLDEFPSFGQLPYMMRSLGVLRSYNVSHHIGLQTLSQLSVVYGENYSKALTTNVIGRKIFFPLAIDDEEREVLSKYLGPTTVHQISEGDSRRKTLGTALDEGTRQSVSYQKTAVPLLAPEEFPHFAPMEGVVKARRTNPIRAFYPAIEDEFLQGDDIPTGIPNGLYVLYKQVNPERQNMGAYTKKLIEEGYFSANASANASAAHVLTNSTPQDRFRHWIQDALDQKVTFRLAGEAKDRVYMRLTQLQNPKSEKELAGDFARSWIGTYQGSDVRITAEGLAQLTSEQREQINWRSLFGALEFWLTNNAERVEGSPEREALATEQRLEAGALLKDNKIYLRYFICTDIFGATPKQLSKRVGKDNFIVIDPADPQAFADELEKAKADKAAGKVNPTLDAETPPPADKQNGNAVVGAPAPALWSEAAHVTPFPEVDLPPLSPPQLELPEELDVSSLLQRSVTLSPPDKSATPRATTLMEFPEEQSDQL